jgi:hypothetical protein
MITLAAIALAVTLVKESPTTTAVVDEGTVYVPTVVAAVPTSLLSFRVKVFAILLS